MFEPGGSSFPEESFKDSSTVTNVGSDSVSHDPFADLSSVSLPSQTTENTLNISSPLDLGSSSQELTPPVNSLSGLSGQGSSIISSDPLSDLSSVALQTSGIDLKANSSITDSKSNTPVFDTPVEAAAGFGNVGSSPFSGDPFADLNVSVTKDTSENISMSANVHASGIDTIDTTPTEQKATVKSENASISDSFGGIGGFSESVFSSDPFAGSDVFGGDQMFSSGNTTDPYAAFAALGNTNQVSDSGSDLPAPPSDWFTSVEKDALKSDQSDLGSLTQPTKTSSANVDFSVQTSVSDPFLSASETSSLFSSSNLSPSDDSKPPPIPKKQGPPRPRPPSISKDGGSATEKVGGNQNKSAVRYSSFFTCTVASKWLDTASSEFPCPVVYLSKAHQAQ